MKFKNVKVGECFDWDGHYYIKTPFEYAHYDGVQLEGNDAGNTVCQLEPECEVSKIVFTGIHDMEGD